MKKILSSILLAAMLVTVTMPAFADTEIDGNQDFTGTPVEATLIAPDVVYVDTEVSIAIDITNIFDRGMPDVTIWVNGELVWYQDIEKAVTANYTFAVDTSTAGEQVFDIEVWTRLGNKNFEQLLFADAITVTVVEQEVDMLTFLNDELDKLLADGDLDWSGDIVIAGYVFHGNGNGTKFSTIDNVKYKLVQEGNQNKGYTYYIEIA